MIRRRRWNAPPSGSTTGLVPNHDAVNRVPRAPAAWLRPGRRGHVPARAAAGDSGPLVVAPVPVTCGTAHETGGRVARGHDCAGRGRLSGIAGGLDRLPE